MKNLNKLNGRNFETIYGNSKERIELIMQYHSILNSKEASDMSKEEARKAIIQIREMEKQVSEKESQNKLLIVSIILTYVLTGILIMFLSYFIVSSYIMSFEFNDFNKLLLGIYGSLQTVWFTIVIGIYAKLNINIKKGGDYGK